MSNSSKQEENFRKALNQPMPKEVTVGVSPSGMLIKNTITEIEPRCKVCGRILKGREAIKRGMGKACAKKAANKQTIDLGERELWQKVLDFSAEYSTGDPDWGRTIDELLFKYKLTLR